MAHGGDSSAETVARAVDSFAPLAGGVARRYGRGLINQTYQVESPRGRWLLQRINPIFGPEMNQNVQAVTEHLAGKGMLTPRVVPAPDGRAWVDLGGDGIWRAMTWIDGESFDVPQSLPQIASAAHLTGRFHAALADLDYRFQALRVGVHDLPRHLATLGDAVARGSAHRLYPAVHELARQIVAGAAQLAPQIELVTIVGHGDLKLNNLRFAGAEPPERERALCLIDLDTVGPIPLAFELGDCWRSWCNPAGEDPRSPPSFDLEVFVTALSGYGAGLGRELSQRERRQLLDGVEWISLELAARFAADALNESYFGWDPAGYPGRGEHNLARAEAQFALHRSARATRAERAALLGVDP